MAAGQVRRWGRAMRRKPEIEQRFCRLQGEAETRLWDALECELEAADAWRRNQVALFVERARELANEYRAAASIYECMAHECETALLH
jgi:hypothetical protein